MYEKGISKWLAMIAERILWRATCCFNLPLLQWQHLALHWHCSCLFSRISWLCCIAVELCFSCSVDWDLVSGEKTKATRRQQNKLQYQAPSSPSHHLWGAPSTWQYGNVNEGGNRQTKTAICNPLTSLQWRSDLQRPTSNTKLSSFYSTASIGSCLYSTMWFMQKARLETTESPQS